MSKAVHFFDERFKVIICNPRLREGETKTMDKSIVTCEECKKLLRDKHYQRILKEKVRVINFN